MVIKMATNLFSNSLVEQPSYFSGLMKKASRRQEHVRYLVHNGVPVTDAQGNPYTFDPIKRQFYRVENSGEIPISVAQLPKNYIKELKDYKKI
jgi:hypothetical protein